MQKDDSFCLGREMRQPQESAGFGVGWRISGKTVGREQRGQRGNTNRNSGGASPEKLAGRHRRVNLRSQSFIHGWPFCYCFVIVSSRLRIMLATVVHAASSRGSRFASAFDSPTESNFAAFSRSW